MINILDKGSFPEGLILNSAGFPVMLVFMEMKKQKRLPRERWMDIVQTLNSFLIMIFVPIVKSFVKDK